MLDGSLGASLIEGKRPPPSLRPILERSAAYTHGSQFVVDDMTWSGQVLRFGLVLSRISALHTFSLSREPAAVASDGGQWGGRAVKNKH